MHIQPIPVQTRFDPGPLRHEMPFDRLKEAVLFHPITMLALRRFAPLLPFRGMRFIARYDDAREALRRTDVFGVPWAAKFQMQAPSREPFVLATDEPALHACGERQIMEVFRYNDGPRIEAIAGSAARDIMNQAGATIDVVQDLFLPVTRRVYQDHYGIDTPKGPMGDLTEGLTEWLMAISNYTFRQIGQDDEAKEIASAAIFHLTQLIDKAITQARLQHGIDTIATRLIALQRRAPSALRDDALRSIFIGTVSGHAPVSTAAAGHIIEVLLDRPRALEATRQAARDNDDSLTRHLLEALRFWPINPGLWRICRQDYVLAAGTSRARLIRQGEKVLVFLRSAMQDEMSLRHPWRFDPERPASDSMVFGYGMHWCSGAPLAVAQLVPMLKPLLLRGFSRVPGAAGRTRRFGAFPEHMPLRLGNG